MPKWPVHARITGPVVMIGFGSIGKGTLPLIERHFHYDKKRFVVIDPEDKDRKMLDDRSIRFIHQSVTKGAAQDVAGGRQPPGPRRDAYLPRYRITLPAATPPRRGCGRGSCGEWVRCVARRSDPRGADAPRLRPIAP